MKEFLIRVGQEWQHKRQKGPKIRASC